MKPFPSQMLEVLMPGIVRATVVLSLFLLFAGHNAPGGGFVGGLVASIAFVLVFATHGADAMRRAARFSPPVYLGTGLVIAGITGVVPMLFGDPFLSSAKATLELPLLGKLSLTSALPFDIG